MSAVEQEIPLKKRQADKDVDTQREKFMNQIKADHEKFGDFQMSKSVQRNVLLLGRTHTGKSTIKSMLVNPMVVAEEQNSIVATKYPQFETFHVAVRKTITTNEPSEEDLSTTEFSEENVPTNESYKEDVSTNVSSEKDMPTTESSEDVVLNIIDTPSLFERGTDEIKPRDNTIIMQTIDVCVNQEITKFHVICFCIAVTVGITQEDIQAIKLLLETIGDKIASNSCLIITHCESKDNEQRQAMKSRLAEDKDFKLIAPFFKKGIFFSGVLNRDDYRRGSENLIDQYLTVSEYRTELIKLFRETAEPFPLIDTLISDSQRAQNNQVSIASKFEQMEMDLQQAKQDLIDTKDHLQETEAELKETQSKPDNRDAELRSAQEELKKKEADLEEHQNLLTETQSKLGNMGAELRSTQEELKKKEADLEEKQSLLKQKELAETELQLIIAGLQKKIATAENTTDSSKTDENTADSSKTDENTADSSKTDENTAVVV